MTDQQPIMVDASPVPAQVIAGVRQVLLGLSAVATAFGASRLGTGLSTASLAATMIATGLSGAVTIAMFVWGQLHTRSAAKKLATVAEVAPDEIAQVKQ